MQVRLTDGEKAGDVVEVEDSVGEAWIVAGKAEPASAAVTEEVVETAVVPETPETPKTGTKRRTPEKPETR